ncbi:hypothetical protein HMPREF9004_0948 [Schaalia cardiffensis F0333]|uniref:Uncharacterized protein n=1 Tax=Schaalia cardiffensis F0333 TaxID=888050 RepID=N6WDS1_9ACTO|nr:hypothetical protein HMPREF9004_0948 [Schaalia cardiffensis F0333]
MEAVTTSGGVISPPQFVNPSTSEGELYEVRIESPIKASDRVDASI